MARSDTRQRMIDTALRLFQSGGYRAASWRRVVNEAGTPWGSAHHFFPEGKEQLGVAAIDAGSEMVGALIAHCFASSSNAAEAVGQWFTATAAFLEASGFREGCPIACVVLEIGPDDARLGVACAEAIGRWQQDLEARLVADGYGAERAAELATVVLASLEGALLLGRALRSAAPLQLMARQVAELLRRARARRSA